MKRASAAGVFALCLGLAAGCGGRDRDQNPANTAAGDQQATASDQKQAGARPTPITQTGCLTANGDRFVLTDLERRSESATDQPTTQAYQLVGNDEELRQHVGKQVRVTGEAEPTQVSEVRESTPPAPQSGTSGTGTATGTAGQKPESAGAQPQVKSETETRLEVTKLRVQSVTPTGESCAAETRPGARR